MGSQVSSLESEPKELKTAQTPKQTSNSKLSSNLKKKNKSETKTQKPKPTKEKNEQNLNQKTSLIDDVSSSEQISNNIQTPSTELGFGLAVWALWLNVTMLFIFNLLAVLKIISAIRNIGKSTRRVVEEQSTAILSLFFSIVQFVIVTAIFIWFHIVCKRCSKKILNYALSSCVGMQLHIEEKKRQKENTTQTQI